MRLLLIEDDADLARALKLRLTQEGFACDICPKRRRTRRIT